MAQEDNRKFKSTLAKPTRIRLRHEGKVVYDATHEGDVEIYLRDHAVPYSGVTELLIGDGDKAFASWKCS